MDSIELVSKAHDAMEQHAKLFIDSGKVSRTSWGKSGEGIARGKRMSSFVALWPQRNDYYEYKFLEHDLEGQIRVLLVNPTIRDLLDLFGRKSKFAPMISQLDVHTGTDWFEEYAGYEFYVEYNDKRVAYRYTYSNLKRIDIQNYLVEMGFDHIEVIDWSDPDTHDADQHLAESLSRDYPGQVRAVSIRSFFEEFFSRGLFEDFLECARKAVLKVNEAIGIQVIPRLSISRLPDFKMSLLGRIHQREHAVWKYTPPYSLDRNKKDAIRRKTRIRPEELTIIESAFFGDSLYRAVCGDSDFATSFVTAEYLHDVFDQDYCFDYTAIINGYVKSVEQLANALMLQTVRAENPNGLWIKKNNKDLGGQVDLMQEKKSAFEMGRRVWHVPFNQAHVAYFDTTLNSLANLLHDNVSNWRVDEDSVHAILRILRNYTNYDRNDYFHKHNLASQNPSDRMMEVERIRSNTYTVLFLLLGGYVIKGTAEEVLTSLGASRSLYSELSRTLGDILWFDTDFILQFRGEKPFKAIRIPVIERRYENLPSPGKGIAFVRVDSFKDVNLKELVSNLNDEDMLVLNDQCIPTKIWLLPQRGTEQLIWDI